MSCLIKRKVSLDRIASHDESATTIVVLGSAPLSGLGGRVGYVNRALERITQGFYTHYIAYTRYYMTSFLAKNFEVFRMTCESSGEGLYPNSAQST